MAIAVMTFAVCFAGGFFPAVSADLYLLSAAVLVGPSMLPVLIMFGTAGQIAGKSATYLIATCAGGGARPRSRSHSQHWESGEVVPVTRLMRVPPWRTWLSTARNGGTTREMRSFGTRTAWRRPVERSIHRLRLLHRRRPHLACAVVALSALASVPPFFAVAAACGALRLGLCRFVLAATAGRLVRNAFIVAAPSLLRGA